MRTVLAIDPGASGGIVARLDGNFSAYPNPETCGDLILLFHRLLVCDVIPTRPIAYIEKVAPFIPGGGASMMFEYGRQVERPVAILQTLGVPVIMVPPKTWQKALQLGNSDRVRITDDMNADQRKRTQALNSIHKKDWKNKLKAEAQRRFPTLNITLKTADAALLMAYALTVES